MTQCHLEAGAWGGLSALHLVFATIPGPMALAGMGRAVGAESPNHVRRGSSPSVCWALKVRLRLTAPQSHT
jgi:hypothetical protein